MQKLLAATAVLFLAALCSAAALAQTPNKPLAFDQYKKAVSNISIKDHTMPLEKFTKLQGKPDLVVLDLRSEREYKEGHIKGALNLGADITAERLKQLVPDKKRTIVIYCTNNFMPTRRISLTFASLPQIVALDYPNVYVLEDLWQKDFKEVDKFKTGPLWQPATVEK